MNDRFARIIFFFILIILNLDPSHAHSGGTNSSGCHYNHSTGDYHCHVKDDLSETKSNPSRIPASFMAPDKNVNQYCCKICTKGKACGDTCISKSRSCHVGAGCACDG